MTKSPTPTESQKSKAVSQRRHKNLPITQRLRTDLGLSVGATTVFQLVCLNRFTESHPSHKPQNMSNLKDKHYKICELILPIKTEDQQPTKAEEVISISAQISKVIEIVYQNISSDICQSTLCSTQTVSELRFKDWGTPV